MLQHARAAPLRIQASRHFGLSLAFRRIAVRAHGTTLDVSRRPTATVSFELATLDS